MNPRSVEALLIGILMSLGEMTYEDAVVAAGQFLTSCGSGGRNPDSPVRESTPISEDSSTEELPEELQMHPEAALLDEKDPDRAPLRTDQVQEMVYQLSEMFLAADGPTLLDGAQPLSPGVIAGLGTAPVGVLKHTTFTIQGPQDERPHQVEAIFFFDIGTGALVKLAEKHTALKEPPSGKKAETPAAPQPPQG